MRSILLAVALVVAFPGPARAQEDDGAPPAVSALVVRERVAAAEDLLARGDADGAIAALETLRSELWDRDQLAEVASLGCVLGEARLRRREQGEEGTRAAVRELGSGLAVATDATQRFACLRRGALALTHAAGRAASATATAETSALDDDLRFRAAVWLRRARAQRDEPALRAAFDALPEELRAQLDRMGSPGLEASGAEELAHTLARARYLADPTRIVDCVPDWDATLIGGGVIDCYETVLPEMGFGAEYPHVAHYYLGGDGARARSIGSTTRLPGFDCEHDIVRTTSSFVRLRAARDGIDGTMRVLVEGGDADGWRNTTAVVDVCDAALGACRSLTIGRTRCDVDDRGVSRCSERWAATARSAGGVLALRRARGTLPAGLATSIPWPVLFAREGAAIADARRARGAGCHAEIADPRPPLNVRAAPDQRSAVAATLANGTMVRTLERHRGWVRIDLPMAGWVWSRSLRQVCDR